MLKYQSALLAVFGSALLVPAICSQDGARGLENSLKETTRALEVLAGIQRGIEARHPSAIALAKQATEPASGEARVRDNRIVTLRDEVNRLQAMNDRMQGPDTQAREVENTLSSPPPLDLDSSPRVIVTTGLSQSAREELSGVALPGTRAARPVASAGEGQKPSGAAKDAGESAADPLRQAQVLFRARSYEECAALLKKRESDPESAWWRGRALERLGRTNDARDCYQKAKDGAAKDSKLATRAAQDLEFLEWKLGFQQKLAAKENKP
jgi:hypothetical protein